MSRDAFRFAVGTLTTWRTPPPTRVDGAVAGRAMLLAPVVVAPLALAVTAALLGVALTGLPTGVAAAVAIAAIALSTRGMHLDGLADLADGLCAGFDRERSLEVMKRSDTGAGGVAAVALVLLVQFAAMDALAAGPGGAIVVGVLVLVSRQMLAWACRRGVVAAAPGGLGAGVAGTVPSAAAAASTLVLLAVAAVLGLAGAGAPALVVLACLVGLAAGHVVLAIARARLGGITGDVLGAAVEVTLAGGLAGAALLLG